MNIEILDTSTLIPFDRNPRTLDERSKSRLLASIQKYGWFKPAGIVWFDETIDADVVIAGNQRLAAVRALDESGVLPLVIETESGQRVIDAGSVPYIRFDGERDEAHALAIRDNTHEGDWDWSNLPDFVAELAEAFDADSLPALTGLDNDMLDDLLSLNGPDLMSMTFDPEPGVDHDHEHDDDQPVGTDDGSNEINTTESLKVTFVLGSLRGQIDIPLYERFVGVLDEIAERHKSRSVPTLIRALLDGFKP